MVSMSNNNLVIKFAECKDEYEKAFQLVYKAYVKQNIISQNESELKTSFYQALPETKVAIAKLDNEVVATISIIPDSKFNLPVYPMYPEILDEYKEYNSVEFGAFAAADDIPQTTFLKLGIFALGYVKFLQKDYIFIAVHPKHGSFYSKIIKFEYIGELKSYDKNNLNNVPVVLLKMDCKKIDSVPSFKKYMKLFNIPWLHNYFKTIAKEASYTEELLYYFFFKKTYVFDQQEKLDYIKTLYPKYLLPTVVRK